jgi:hypothetical protein
MILLAMAGLAAASAKYATYRFDAGASEQASSPCAFDGQPAAMTASMPLAPEVFAGMLADAEKTSAAMVGGPEESGPSTRPDDNPGRGPFGGPGRRGPRDRDGGPGGPPDGGFGPPPDDGPPRGPGMGPGGFDGMRGGMRRGMRPALPGANLPPLDNSDPSEEEWEQIADFWRENSPARWAQYESIEAIVNASDNMGARGPYRAARLRMAMRYRMIEQLRQHHQENLAKLNLQALRAEDSAFSTFQKLRADDTEDNRKAFREAVGSFVDATFAERAERTEMLRKLLRNEDERLERDRGARDEIVRRQSERMEREFNFILSRQPQPTDSATTQPGR